jgi:hypothetical protein
MTTYNDNSDEIIIRSDAYFDLLERRGVKYIRIRKTMALSKLTGLELEIQQNDRYWTGTDNLRRVSLEYYGNPDYWSIIGLVNKKPTDAHWKIGDEILIPDNPRMLRNILQ